MDRYQFEDLISDYLENTLTLAQRKSFENYLETNPNAKTLVDNMRKTINQLNAIPKVTTSTAFMKNLQGRLSAERRIPVKPPTKSYFGFTPLYASVMTGLVIAFLFVSIELFNPEKPNVSNSNRTLATNSNESFIPDEQKPFETNMDDFADVDSDTLNQSDDHNKKKDYSKQIRLVNDK